MTLDATQRCDASKRGLKAFNSYAAKVHHCCHHMTNCCSISSEHSTTFTVAVADSQCPTTPQLLCTACLQLSLCRLSLISLHVLLPKPTLCDSRGNSWCSVIGQCMNKPDMSTNYCPCLCSDVLCLGEASCRADACFAQNSNAEHAPSLQDASL